MAEPPAGGTEIFVRNDKGTEYVGTVTQEAVPLPPSLVFTDYTREPSVLDGTRWPQEPTWTARLAEVQDKEGGVTKFVGFLKGRKKAAVATLEGLVVALLPSDTLSLACFFDGDASQKRGREESEEGYDAFPHFDIINEAARKAAAAQLPAWSKKTARRDNADAMVFRADQDWPGTKKGGCVFFQDARRKYEFFCGERGLLLLSGLLERTSPVMAANAVELEKLGPQAHSIVEEGRRIYGEKPSLRKFGSEAEGKNVTWSDAQYAHVGLQTQYLKLKSLQRFTETYNLCARACDIDEGVNELLTKSPKLRCASLGGGPAFELDALREFCRAKNAETEFAFYSLDLQPGWRPYAEALGCHFVAPFDVSQITPQDVVQACRGPIDVLVISYLFIYCTTPRTADLLQHLLVTGLVRCLFISQRTQDQDIVALLEARGLSVTPLLPQQHGKDQRQLLVLDKSKLKPTGASSLDEDSAFPNVPFAKGT